MKVSVLERARTAILVIPIIVVLLILAVLLYRWSNQMSETTSVRLADSLQMSMVNWHLNLFRDLSDICFALHADSEDASGLGQYARRFADWRDTAPYPEVVANLYVLKSASSSSPQALRLDPSTRQFISGGWPTQFTFLREEMEQSGSKAPERGAQFRDNFYPHGGDTGGWQFDPGIPALVHSVSEGLLVVELNRSVIQQRVLPDLAQRYFTGVDGLDYMVAVVTGGAEKQVIYSSDPEFGMQEVADADGRMKVFGRSHDAKVSIPIDVFHKPSENTGLTGLATSIGTSWFPLIGKSSEDHDWQLIVRHRRGGALGAFVAEMHRRDLAVSFGVLFLLVISVAVLIVVSLRAHRLARLQMDFVTAVSHELRTPLTVITSAAENIAHGVVESRQQVTQYGQVIEGRARQLSRLVEQILLFAATRENRQRYNPRPLEVSEIIEATLAGTADLIEAAGFRLEKEIPAELPKVTGDLFALSQCLQNLITNALKYGGTEQWIGIRASGESLTGELNEDRIEVQISVADRGMGIDARDIPYIFDPFFRTESASAARIHGTGLGLALAKNIAEAMHGRLTVESRPGLGSIFTLHLPCH